MTTPMPTPNTTTFQTQRYLAHSPAAIYAAFADPARLAAWWGPDGFSNTFDTFEFHNGGRWVFVMHGPDGASYPNQSVFQELIPDQRVVVRHACQPFFTLTVGLTPADGGQATQLDWVQAFDDAQVAAAVRHIVEPSNEQNLDRLGRHLGSWPG